MNREHFEEAMSKARRSVSDKDIVQYQQFAAKMKSDSIAAGSANFSFQDETNTEDLTSSTGSGSDSAAVEDDLYGK